MAEAEHALAAVQRKTTLGPGQRPGAEVLSCLHCALARAIRVYSETRLPLIVVRRCDPVWLPMPGWQVYRHLAAFLQRAAVNAVQGPIKLEVLDRVAGKSHVEVMVTVRSGRGYEVSSCRFPRHVLSTLWDGFAEYADAEAGVV